MEMAIALCLQLTFLSLMIKERRKARNKGKTNQIKVFSNVRDRVIWPCLFALTGIDIWLKAWGCSTQDIMQLNWTWKGFVLTGKRSLSMKAIADRLNADRIPSIPRIPNRCPMIINARLLALSASLRRQSKAFWCMFFGLNRIDSMRLLLSPNRPQIFLAFLIRRSCSLSCRLE